MRVVLIPAAGASSRMRGGDKLLEDVDGAPCLRVLVDRAAQVCERVCVTLPAPDHPRAAALETSRAQIVIAANAHRGMAHSLRAGVAAVPSHASGLMILPGDMPQITAQDMRQAWEVYEAQKPIALQCTTEDGALGHPIIFSRKLFAGFDTLSGDRGAFALLPKPNEGLAVLQLKGNRARLDLDTPEDWAAWRASRLL